MPDTIGGSFPGVHYIRDVADADLLVSSMQSAKKLVIIGGGYIGMEVVAAATAWNIDTTVVFPQEHVIARTLGLEALDQIATSMEGELQAETHQEEITSLVREKSASSKNP